MNVRTAFFYCDLSEAIFMEQPQGYENPTKPNHFCKIEETSYVLKQAPRKWFTNINAFIEQNLDIERCSYDTIFYVKKTSNSILMPPFYLYKNLIYGSSLEIVESLKALLCEIFEMKYLK